MLSRRNALRLFGAAGLGAMLPAGHVAAAIPAESGLTVEVLDGPPTDAAVADRWRELIANVFPGLDVNVVVRDGGLVKLESPSGMASFYTSGRESMFVYVGDPGIDRLSFDGMAFGALSAMAAAQRAA